MFADVLDDARSELQGARGLTQGNKRMGPLRPGRFPTIFKPKCVYYELADAKWSWNEPVTDPDLGRLLNQDPVKDNSIMLKMKDYKDWEAVAHQSACMLSHADWFATAIESAEDRVLSSLSELKEEMLIAEPPETAVHEHCLSPAAMFEALEPAIAFVSDSKQLVGSLAKSVQDCARMQLQLLSNMQIARRDLFLSQMPKYIPDETLLHLRQAPLGGEFLFGEDAMAMAHAAKEKGEQSQCQQAMIHQATSALPKSQNQKQKVTNIPLPEGAYQPNAKGKGRGIGRGRGFRSEQFLGDQTPNFRGGRGRGRGGGNRGGGSTNRGGQRGGGRGQGGRGYNKQ
jgi:hypothetical protein